jgi:hypothetical protein
MRNCCRIRGHGGDGNWLEKKDTQATKEFKHMSKYANIAYLYKASSISPKEARAPCFAGRGISTRRTGCNDDGWVFWERPYFYTIRNFVKFHEFIRFQRTDFMMYRHCQCTRSQRRMNADGLYSVLQVSSPTILLPDPLSAMRIARRVTLREISKTLQNKNKSNWRNSSDSSNQRLRY